MNVSNNKLLGFVIAALVVSLLSTVFIISYLNVLSEGDIRPLAGFATSARGNITIYIAPILSITTADDNNITFSGCSPGHVIYSNVTDGNAFGDCPGFVPDYIQLRNDGSFPVNVSVQASDVGEAHGGHFVNALSNDSWVAFHVINSSFAGNFSGGCAFGFPAVWTNMTDNVTLFQACEYLASNVMNNSFSFALAVYVPESSVPSENNLSFTFWGSTVS
jgi:hypothetical protein